MSKNLKLTIDVSDKEIVSELDNLLNPNSENDWLILGHEGFSYFLKLGTSTKIKVEEKGKYL